MNEILFFAAGIVVGGVVSYVVAISVLTATIRLMNEIIDSDAKKAQK